MLQISADVCVATITLWVSPGQRQFLKISLHPLHSIECLAHRRYLRDVWEQTDGTYMMNLSWHSCLLPTGPLSAIYSPHCLSYPHHSGWGCSLFAPVQVRNDAKRRLVSTMSLNPHDSEVSRCRCPGNRESHNVYSLLGSEVPSTGSTLSPAACSVQCLLHWIRSFPHIRIVSKPDIFSINHKISYLLDKCLPNKHMNGWQMIKLAFIEGGQRAALTKPVDTSNHLAEGTCLCSFLVSHQHQILEA